MAKETFNQIKELLDKHKIKYQVLEHEPTPTSEDAARVREKLLGIHRDEILKSGAKAMIVKGKEKYYQLIISAAKRIDFAKASQVIGTKVKFARPEEVLAITGCVPGSVPPFGNLFGIPVYVDHSLLENKTIDFNAGELIKSIQMQTKDWLALVKPVVADFS